MRLLLIKGAIEIKEAIKPLSWFLIIFLFLNFSIPLIKYVAIKRTIHDVVKQGKRTGYLDYQVYQDSLKKWKINLNDVEVLYANPEFGTKVQGLGDAMEIKIRLTYNIKLSKYQSYPIKLTAADSGINKGYYGTGY